MSDGRKRKFVSLKPERVRSTVWEHRARTLTTPAKRDPMLVPNEDPDAPNGSYPQLGEIQQRGYDAYAVL